MLFKSYAEMVSDAQHRGANWVVHINREEGGFVWTNSRGKTAFTQNFSRLSPEMYQLFELHSNTALKDFGPEFYADATQPQRYVVPINYALAYYFGQRPSMQEKIEIVLEIKP